MISIVIPTFNEAENIIPLLKNLVELVNDFEYEIIVIDDDSPDGTSDEVNKYMKFNKRIKLITRIGRSGLSSAIKEGLIFAQGKYLLVLDGDGQHHPSFVLEMLEEIKQTKSDIVIGSRFLNSSKLEGLSNKRSLGSKIANKLARISLSKNYMKLTDYLSGCFCLDKETTKKFIRKIEINGFKFLYELLSLSRGKLSVIEVPLLFKERKFGNSKLDIAIVWDFLISIIHNLTLRLLPRRAISFGLVGISGVFVQLFMTSFLVEIFSIDFYNALPFAVISAATSNFLINNQLTFRSDRLKNLALLIGLLKFLIVASLPVIANVGITTAFYKYISADTFIAQIAGIAIVYAWNYLASSSFVWKKSI
ncbi:glycosyltransferase family 2 protein [uncultured Prochlorococcus sp.]|uniref:glycosyltransferase n=1 Tax=uncultured Prochlorococcus sp. TaxID=159733 RepID=UPI00258D7F46|nr:glycosyltransferase family 2 protein [uncultured Prochlorococcus sp.]